jgi:hypothetical protein
MERTWDRIPATLFLIAKEWVFLGGCIDLEEMLLEQNNNNIGNRKIGNTLNRIPLYQLQNR